MNWKRGYIALTAAVMMSVLIVVVVLALSLVSFVSQANVSASYYGAVSRGLSRSCVEVALLKLSGNSSYAGGENIAVQDRACEILPVEIQGSRKIIKTRGSLNGVTSNLLVTIDAADLSLISWEEVKSL